MSKWPPNLNLIPSIVEYGKNLQHLNLECTSISTHWGAGQVAKINNLKYLNLFNCRLFDSSDLTNLAYNCKKLECLNIEEVIKKNKEYPIAQCTISYVNS